MLIVPRVLSSWPFADAVRVTPSRSHRNIDYVADLDKLFLHNLHVSIHGMKAIPLLEVLTSARRYPPMDHAFKLYNNGHTIAFTVPADYKATVASMTADSNFPSQSLSTWKQKSTSLFASGLRSPRLGLAFGVRGSLDNKCPSIFRRVSFCTGCS